MSKVLTTPLEAGNRIQLPADWAAAVGQTGFVALERTDEGILIRPTSGAVVAEDKAVYIVDRGRGPQLSTCRITVQDVVPYLQQNCSWEEIKSVMPILTKQEFQTIEQYVRDNHEAVMGQDRRIRERNAQRTTPPEIEEIRKKGHAKMMALMEQYRRNREREIETSLA